MGESMIDTNNVITLNCFSKCFLQQTYAYYNSFSIVCNMYQQMNIVG